MFRKILSFEIGKIQIFSCCGIFKDLSRDKIKSPIQKEHVLVDEVNGKILGNNLLFNTFTASIQWFLFLVFRGKSILF